MPRLRDAPGGPVVAKEGNGRVRLITKSGEGRRVRRRLLDGDRDAVSSVGGNRSKTAGVGPNGRIGVVEAGSSWILKDAS
ncbi:MAG: hypothetical protein ACO3P9_11300 [Phycisphaerales bacterium]